MYARASGSAGVAVLPRHLPYPCRKGPGAKKKKKRKFSHIAIRHHRVSTIKQAQTLHSSLESTIPCNRQHNVCNLLQNDYLGLYEYSNGHAF